MKNKLTIVTSRVFNKQLKKLVKQGKDISKIKEVINKLSNHEPLDIKYRDHKLINDKYYNGCRECHIEPDWLLIYKYVDNNIVLYLVETGSHSELFNL